MDSSINEQTWETIKSINFSIQENKKEDKRLTQARRATNVKELEKDAIVSKSGKDVQTTKSVQIAKKPTLTKSTCDWAGFQKTDEDTPGLIAIIGKVLALQARTNSTFWSTLWKQASESMMMEVKFAPIIGAAIKAQYTAQAAETQARADQSLADGTTNFFMFVGSIGMGFALSGEEPPEPSSNDPASEYGDEGVGANEQNNIEDGMGENELDNAENTNNNEMDKTTNNEESSFSRRAKKVGKWMWGKAGKVKTKLTATFGKGMLAAQLTGQLSQGITGWFIDAPSQAKQAVQQGIQGQQAALSKESEQYAQFYGQSFSRSEDLRQGSGQNIDYAMNILKSAADSITQTVTSMFRG